MISESKFIYRFLVRGIVYCVQEISFVRVSFKHGVKLQFLVLFHQLLLMLSQFFIKRQSDLRDKCMCCSHLSVMRLGLIFYRGH